MSPDDALKILNSTNGARYWAIWKIQAFINHMSEMLEKEKREASAKGELNAQD